MKLKTLVVVVAVLALISAAAHFLSRPPQLPPADSRIGQPLIASAIVDQASTLRLNENGKTVTLVKKDGTWRISEYHDFPADFTKLSRLVADLTSAKLERLVTQNAERIEGLEFKDTGLAFGDSANKETWAIVLGKNAEGGGRFVRFGTENKAFLTRVNTYLDVEPKNWADTTLLSLKTDDIAQVEMSFADGTPPLVASRTKKDDPFSSPSAPTGKRLKNDRILSLIGSAGSLRFSDTNESSDANAIAAKANARGVKFTTFDGKNVTVEVGRKPEQKIVKAPDARKDGSTGPAALGNLADLAKDKETPPQTKAPGAAENPTDGGGPAKVAEATETIPAGPVFVFVTSSDSSAAVNALMGKRAFQVYESVLTGLPATSGELFEDAPAGTAPTAAN